MLYKVKNDTHYDTQVTIRTSYMIKKFLDKIVSQTDSLEDAMEKVHTLSNAKKYNL